MDFYRQLSTDRATGAHRGSRALWPENTLKAFEAAMGHFDFIELDIQPSRDGELMILHDETMERTTDIDAHASLPRPHRIDEHDAAWLRRVDAGSWFAQRDPFGTQAAGLLHPEAKGFAPIPTLPEVVTLCREHRMPLNVEIKDSPRADTERLLHDLLETIAPLRAEGIPLLVSSFNHRYLTRLRELDPTLDLAANVEHTHPPDLLRYLEELGVIGYHVDAPLIESTPVAELTALGITCGAFTLNDPAEQAACFEKGFQAVFADMTPDVYRKLHANP